MTSNSGINKIFLLGEIVVEPRCYAMESGDKEYHFTVLTKENYEKKNQPVEHLELHHIRLPLHLMPADERLNKGSIIHIEGKIQTMNWIDDAQVTQWKTDILVLQLNLIRKAKSSAYATS